VKAGAPAGGQHQTFSVHDNRCSLFDPHGTFPRLLTRKDTRHGRRMQHRIGLRGGRSHRADLQHVSTLANEADSRAAIMKI
jgi:hypothetical protein